MNLKQVPIKKQLTLSKTERLKSRKTIEQLFKAGKSFAVFPIRVYYMSATADAAPLQAGFGVSTKNFKKAVDRNRVKRVMREAYRLQKPELADVLKTKNICLSLFLIYTAKELPLFENIVKKTAAILERLKKLMHEIDTPPA
jgi:ribonuclease P protein component